MHQARKRFGQNFLIDQGIIDRIIRAIHPQAHEHLLEIGPGQGAITALLLQSCPNLNVVELDRDLIPILKEKFQAYPELQIHQADALKFDFSNLKAPLRVVGNLPYNISTPLIFKLLSYQGLISDMHFMLQKEVVERMASCPGEKSYGRLSIMCQYHCEIEHLFDVAPECFRPIPKVDSAIVRLRPHAQKVITAKNPQWLDTVVKSAFQQRRKTLRNVFKNLIEADIIEQVTGSLSLRPENLSVEQYVELANLSQPPK